MSWKANLLLLLLHLFRPTGKGREILALPNAEPTQRITYHPHSAPLHKIKTDNMLPNKLLTPFQVSVSCMSVARDQFSLIKACI